MGCLPLNFPFGLLQARAYRSLSIRKYALIAIFQTLLTLVKNAAAIDACIFILFKSKRTPEDFAY
jgi:hypothetical protein